MARALYGPGAQVCPACSRKTAFYTSYTFTEDSPDVTVVRCNKCSALSWHGETIKAGFKLPINWAVAAKAIQAQIKQDELLSHAAKCRANDLRKLLSDKLKE